MEKNTNKRREKRITQKYLLSRFKVNQLAGSGVAASVPECLPCRFRPESFSVTCVPGRLSHHGNALRGAVQGRYHVGPLHVGQDGAQRPQGGALLLGPVREEGAGGSLAAPKQIQLFGLVAQCCAHLPPSPASSFL